jgi:hypothetical protein
MLDMLIQLSSNSSTGVIYGGFAPPQTYKNGI